MGETAFDFRRKHHCRRVDWSWLRDRLVYAIPGVDYDAAERTNPRSRRVKTTPELETVAASCWVVPRYYDGALGGPLKDVYRRVAQMRFVRY